MGKRDATLELQSTRALLHRTPRTRRWDGEESRRKFGGWPRLR
jgi:hypothetical protein